CGHGPPRRFLRPWPVGGTMSEQRVTVYVLQPKDRTTLQLQWVDPDNGKRKTRSTKTSDPDDAERQRADLEYELNHGRHQEASRMSCSITSQRPCATGEVWKG